MSDSNQPSVSFDSFSPELQCVIRYEQAPEAMYTMIASVHDASSASVKEAWEKLPASAQNILDNYDQFHALVAISQSYAGIDALSELEKVDLSEMSDEERDNYKAQILDDVLSSCVKDLSKQLKQARLKPGLKREFQAIFQK
ncbi:DUF3069 domain-containing protein [Salinivibrio sharmensis]|uniref:DUF3069 domain-containing protein n=1 Tax=Salinivibrio sharmensis TaxID=390883 RepID=A0ABX3KFZ2_9GAMM|nr:DUF3069 domain-containing protein [Salinivibrio sharmensis]OOE88009.1 hypothetical protein BZG74_10010 [Salinivibrio sharmensis]